MEIDELCRRILALRQPAACDLRFITIALKIVTDLERIGDLAVNIAERVDRAEPGGRRSPPYVDLPRLAELAQEQAAGGARRLRGRGRGEGARRCSSGDDRSTRSTSRSSTSCSPS